MRAGETTVLEKSGPRADDALQRLLLRFLEAADQGTQALALIQFFCQETLAFFQVDGTYFWRSTSPDELLGAETDGRKADFATRRLTASERALAAEAIRRRRTLFASDPALGCDPKAPKLTVMSLMASPLVVANEAIGALIFVHASARNYFNDDVAAKATILAGQLGGLLEGMQLLPVGQEHRRGLHLSVDSGRVLDAAPDAYEVASAIADRLRVLLRTPSVCILSRHGEKVTLHAVAADTQQRAASIHSRFDRKGAEFFADLADRAIAAGEPISVAIDSASHALADWIPAGTLLAAPIRTPRGDGAVLIYPRKEGAFTALEKSLVAAMTELGAMVMANATQLANDSAKVRGARGLREVASELSSAGNLDDFLRRLVVSAADFLGFRRSFVGLLEGEMFQVRWRSSGGKAEPVRQVFANAPISQTLLNGKPLWFNDPAQAPTTDLETESPEARQLLAVPLLGSEGCVLGSLGVLDRLDGREVSVEDVRSAQALAAEVAPALEAIYDLHLTRERNRHADSLERLASELNSELRLIECAQIFVSRTAELTRAQAAVFAIQRGESLETLIAQGADLKSNALSRRFDQSLADALVQHPAQIVSGSASELFGSELSSQLAWNDCAVVRMVGSAGELVGVLCLANRGEIWEEEDTRFLHAITRVASVAIENARLFTRMDQANRHWIEIFDAITDYIVAHDQSDHILRVNRPLAEFIGVQPYELIGVNMGALLAIGNDSPMQSCPFCRSTTDVSTDEFVLPVLDRTYLVSTSRVHGANSEGLQTIHVLKDITDRREAERRYRELFDNIQEGVFFSTPDGRFVEVNDALVRILGYRSREELLKADVRTQVCLSPKQYEELAAQMEQHSAVRNHEETLRRQDGSHVQVLINAFAVRDAQQRMVQYRGVMLDISGLKTFQSELQRERDFSGKILNNTQSLILVADTAGLVSYANRRWYEMGYQQNQLLSRPLEELIIPARRQALNEAFAATLAGQQIDNLEVRIEHGDGRVGHFSMNLSPMRDDQGNVASIVVVMSDVTDAATLQAKLLHTEKMAAVGQLVSGVAHEVNNPLTAILGFADLLMENPEVPETALKDLRVILEQAQRTKQIVQNLLSFARQMPPQRKPVQLNTILSRTVQLRAYDLHSRGAQVVEQFDPDLPQAVGDAHQLQQVFLNILNNAYDAVRDTGRPARIEIKTTNLGDFVEVSFRDNGYGISFPERVFDPFFTTKEIGKGTGLGLSICYGIVREHGGEILCHNNADGEGATFIVRLPTGSDTASGANQVGGAS